MSTIWGLSLDNRPTTMCPLLLLYVLLTLYSNLQAYGIAVITFSTCMVGAIACPILKVLCTVTLIHHVFPVQCVFITVVCCK
jgi:hypothetical protein